MALIITNHTLSSTWVWLEWQLSPDQLFFNYQVSVFSVCYGNDSSSSSSKANMTGHSGSAPSVNSTCPPALEPPCWCRRYPPSASSANVTNLTSNTTYYFFLKYLTTLLDLSSLWSQQLAITTLQGEFSRSCSNLPFVAIFFLLVAIFSHQYIHVALKEKEQRLTNI